MLNNKYLCPPSKDFDPMKMLLLDLVEDVNNALKEQNPLGKEKALQILSKYLVTLKLIYGVMKKALEDEKSSQVIQSLPQFHIRAHRSKGFNLSDYCIGGMGLVSECNAFLKAQTFESLYFRLNHLISENNFHKGEFKKPKGCFIDMEAKILHFIAENVVPPLLDPFFNEIKHWFKYTPYQNRVVTMITFPMEYTDRISKITDLLNIFSEEYKKIIESNEIIRGKYKAIYEHFQLVKEIKLLLDSKIKENYHDVHIIKTLPVLKRLFKCLKDAHNVLNDAESLLFELKHITTKKPPEKSASEVPPASEIPHVPLQLSAPSVAWPESPLQTDNEPKNDDLDSTSESEDSSEVEIAKSKSPVVLFSKPQVQETPKPIELENPLLLGLGNTARKTIQKIFDGSLKIKYVDLVTLIQNLNGTEDKKTGSSARKLILPDEKVFLHKRHGRDRQNYADPKVIKRIKKLLIAMGITLETCTEAVNARSMRNRQR